MGCSNIPLLGRDLMPGIEMHGARYKISWDLKFQQRYFSECYLQ